MQQQPVTTEFSKTQRLVCLGITSAVRTTPSIPMESLLGLLPLHLVIMGGDNNETSQIARTTSGKYAGLGCSIIAYHENHVSDNLESIQL